jgi:hypothetical protein
MTFMKLAGNAMPLAVVNPGLEVRLYRNTILLSPPNNRTTLLKYFNNYNKKKKTAKVYSIPEYTTAAKERG